MLTYCSLEKESNREGSLVFSLPHPSSTPLNYNCLFMCHSALLSFQSKTLKTQDTLFIAILLRFKTMSGIFFMLH